MRSRNHRNAFSLALPVIFLLIWSCKKNSPPSHAAHDWENPAVLGINQEPAHSHYIPDPDIPAALTNDPDRSSFYQSLNGVWKFHYANKPDDRPAGFYKEAYDVSRWTDISVPGNWELQGFGVPIYTDEEYPFPCDPPRIPHDDNPVGSYRRSFAVPDEWEGRRVYIHFGSVKSALYLWINGNYAGYSQGSKTPAEFDITPFLRKGENSLSLEVYRYSDGAYLEGQDYWRISGIERDVYLYSTPPVRIRDFFARTDLDANYRNGMLNVPVLVQNLQDRMGEGFRIRIEKEFLINGPAEIEIAFDLEIENPKKWTAETPYLYTLLL